MRYVLGETSIFLIGVILKLWGHCWISTATSRTLTTLVVRATIWLCRAATPDAGTSQGEER